MRARYAGSLFGSRIRPFIIIAEAGRSMTAVRLSFVLTHTLEFECSVWAKAVFMAKYKTKIQTKKDSNRIQVFLFIFNAPTPLGFKPG